MNMPMRLVFKIEIETLFNGGGVLSQSKMDHLALLCSDLQNSGMQVMMVSSGAIALGSARLGLDSPPSGLIKKQAVAAVGQAELIKSYQGFFDSYHQMIAQVLITHDVVTNPVRNKNAHATFFRLLELGIIAVVNENDSVSTNDIIENDNYPLAHIVANITDADAIVIKTLLEGHYQVIFRNFPILFEVREEMLYSLNGDAYTGQYISERTEELYPKSINATKIINLDQ
jgi:glutamate 5-kinase